MNVRIRSSQFAGTLTAIGLAAGLVGLALPGWARTAAPKPAAAVAGRDAVKIAPARARSFSVGGGKFLLDGQPFQILAGEIHYPRIPRQYWRHRLKMARAMGLNAIATYVFWNVHEPEKGRFNFSGDADLAEFIRIAQEEGLFVLLRPGPYVCAEWEFGGLPYWLLNERDDGPNGGKPILLRSRNERFIRYTQRYMNEVAKQCAPLQFDRGGPILMVQVENEYGSFGSDKVYMGRVRDAVRAAGFTVPLYTADGPSQTPNGCIDGALPGVNGASGPDLLRVVDQQHPGGPYFSPEIYPGWLDHWGEKFIRSDEKADLRTLDWFVKNGHSISLYMFHGGTNFGFWNGANFGANYEPHITSYDYDAPLDEAGRPTSEYRAMRDLIRGALPAATVPEIPATNPVVAVPRFELKASGSLLGTLGSPVRSERVRSMEDLNQAFGFVLYRTRVKGPGQRKLTVREVRDYAVVMLNGKTVGTLDRRWRQQTLALELPAGESSLEIVVENGGRINYGPQLQDNRKGITQSVLLDDEELLGWDHFPLPLDRTDGMKLDGKKGAGPTFYRGSFSLDRVGDTWLDLRGWTKGVVWVNGHNLGRYWRIGPQQTLYAPAPWLRRGQNEVTVLELAGTSLTSLAGVAEPVLDDLQPEPRPARTARARLATPPSLAGVEALKAGEFADAASPQTVRFASTRARYVALQSVSAFDGQPWASCGEFHLIGADGKPLKRGKWRILYADSEEQASEDGSAENVLDSDLGTFWHSEWSQRSPAHPHFFVVDLGEPTEFSGFLYIPRAGDKPAKIKGYRFYASAEPFGAK